MYDKKSIYLNNNYVLLKRKESRLSIINILVFNHHRLALLAQRAEISLVEKVKKEPVTPSPTQAKNKKAQRIKALSPKVQRDEQLEVLINFTFELLF